MRKDADPGWTKSGFGSRLVTGQRDAVFARAGRAAVGAPNRKRKAVDSNPRRDRIV